MINYIFLLIVLPFLPVWQVSDFSENKEIFPSVFSWNQQKNDHQEVLGASWDKENNNKNYSQDNFQTCNLFPLEAANAKYMPMRKKGYKDLKLWAGSSVAIDIDSGTILHYDNGRKRTQIASLTKIMTAILVVENVENLKEEVVVTKEALNVPGTVVGCPTSVLCTSNQMYHGEKVRAEDLLKAMLLNSANDAATALGIHVAGSEDLFVKMMNSKAKELGLKDTNFCTPSGLEKDGQESECYSSAYDIARIAIASLKYNIIWEIMRIPEGKFYSTDGKYMHELKNTDLLLESIPNCLGGKTGFTPLAGKSLLLGAKDSTNKHRIIAVVLNDENRWEDMRTLISWVFQNYEWR